MDTRTIHAGLPDDMNKIPALAQTGLLYSITVLLFLTVGAWAQNREFYSGILITEFVIILVPALVFLKVFGYDTRRILRLNRISILNLFLIFCIMLFAIPIAGIFNMLNLWLVKYLFGNTIVTQPPAAFNMETLLLNILVIGGSAGICEEVLFRGIVQRAFEKFGVVKSIMTASLLFSLIHIDFQKLFGTFFLGVLIGFIVYRTNSLFGGMFAHFINNSSAVFIIYISNKFIKMMEGAGLSEINGQQDANQIFSMFENMTGGQIASLIVSWAFIILFCLCVLTGLIIAFVRTTSATEIRAGDSDTKARPAGFLGFIPGLLLIGMQYVNIGLVLLGKEPVLFNIFTGAG